jgi:predicted phosphodiesterase
VAVMFSAHAIVPRSQAQSHNNFRFAILGDRTGNPNQAVYAEIWKEIDSEHPNFVINVGDSIQGGSDSTAESEWRDLRRLWARYPYPLYLTPGNHDIWSDASRRIFEKESGHAPTYSFTYQNAHFTILDNSGSLSLSDSQMQFLTQDLERNKSRIPKFIVFHQPFWLIPLKFQSGDFPFHQLARKYSVSLIVSGHGHQYVSIMRDGVGYVEIGSSGGKLKGEGFERGWFYQHATVDVNSSRVDLTIKEIEAPFGQGRSFRPAWNEQGASSAEKAPALQR